MPCIAHFIPVSNFDLLRTGDYLILIKPRKHFARCDMNGH